MSGSHIRRLMGVLVLLTGALSPAVARVWYVNLASTQSPFDGSSWAQGNHTIRTAINVSAPGDEIWVAQGDYTEHLVVPAQRALYGGFKGTEDYRVEAHPETYLTYITGSVAPLDGIHGSCITVEANVTKVAIDGFV